METKNNLFSSLFKCAHRQSENFCSEGLVWVLNYLVEHEPQSARRLLNTICGDDFDYADGYIEIYTQECTEVGRPDICIRTTKWLIFIEVKQWNKIDAQQLKKYRKVLTKCANQNQKTKLITLTVHQPDFSKTKYRPDRELQWYEVANSLKQLSLKNTESSFIVQQFIIFMEEQVMTIERIGWGDWNKGKPKFSVDLSSEESHFFCRTKESQLHFLCDFLKKAYSAACSCKKTN